MGSVVQTFKNKDCDELSLAISAYAETYGFRVATIGLTVYGGVFVALVAFDKP